MIEAICCEIKDGSDSDKKKFIFEIITQKSEDVKTKIPLTDCVRPIETTTVTKILECEMASNCDIKNGYLEILISGEGNIDMGFVKKFSDEEYHNEEYHDLGAYDVPKKIFTSRNLSKKHNLLVMFNEYVKEFGNYKGTKFEEYFAHTGEIDSCEYEGDGSFTINGSLDESSLTKISDHNEMKILIEMVKIIINYYNEYVSELIKNME
jgi:hypothetical protein